MNQLSTMLAAIGDTGDLLAVDFGDQGTAGYSSGRRCACAEAFVRYCCDWNSIHSNKALAGGHDWAPYMWFRPGIDHRANVHVAFERNRHTHNVSFLCGLSQLHGYLLEAKSIGV